MTDPSPHGVTRTRIHGKLRRTNEDLRAAVAHALKPYFVPNPNAVARPMSDKGKLRAAVKKSKARGLRK